jgi:hypothetical protein
MIESHVAVIVALVCLTALVREHWNFLVSMVKTCKTTSYGVYVDIWTIFTVYVWFFVKGNFVDRVAVLQSVEMNLRQILGLTDKDSDDQVLITHSCRTIFYVAIQGLLDEAKQRTGQRKIRIATPSVHFGSFFRLLRTLPDAEVEYYEIDLIASDWTLNEATIDEAKIAECDLILCQNLFGVPLAQDKLFALGRKYNIPVMEDCVQSGSLFGQHKGHSLADFVVWSCGLDKTPACLGGGLGHFRSTPQGMRMYRMCKERHDTFAIDSFKDRAIGVGNQTLHVMLAHNAFGINNLFGILAYYFFSRKRHDYIQWYAMSLSVRKDKKFTPFQHATSKFCRQPSAYQLLAIRYGMNLKRMYTRIALHEVSARAALLGEIPSQYHTKLFPWLTSSVLEQHVSNGGISEFTWVAAPSPERRQELCQFLNDHFVISMINTTWESTQLMPVGQTVCDSLVYLPNLNHSNQRNIRYLGQVLTKWCETKQL